MKIKLLFIFSALLATMTAWADSVKYIDTDGKEKSVEATVLTGGGATTLGAGWYVATGPVNYTGTVTLSGGNETNKVCEGTQYHPTPLLLATLPCRHHLCSVPKIRFFTINSGFMLTISLRFAN